MPGGSWCSPMWKPLSLEKKIMVFSLRPLSSSAVRTSPTPRSSARIIALAVWLCESRSKYGSAAARAELEGFLAAMAGRALRCLALCHRDFDRPPSAEYPDGEGGVEWATTWRAGDVLGVAADLGAGTRRVAKNGAWGDAFTLGEAERGAGVYPALSAKEVIDRTRNIIKGVRMNKRAALLLQNRKIKVIPADIKKSVV